MSQMKRIFLVLRRLQKMAVLSLAIIGVLFVIFIVIKAEANRRKLEYSDLKKF